MKQKVYLGIDTSCYTTSVAVLDEAGKLVGEARKHILAGDFKAWKDEITPRLMQRM